MNADRWDQIQAVFDAALDYPPDEREAFLQEACEGDAALYQEVQSLLNADDDHHTVFDGLAVDVVGLPDDVSFEGRRAGSYRLVRPIGSGGMGAVYLAERADGLFEQQVAVKLIKPGMDSLEILGRFRSEQQILARLQHPHIARLLDGGLTDDGHPYFVMEYVEGRPVDAYCDAHRLSVDDRLRLFQTISEAVHYAHRNLVVHRDLKPDNILVTDDGTVKLLDFGIAKVLGADDEHAVRTRTGLHVMTPEYAAPEQIRGEPVTTATDVYALGLILYELLTGHRPYRITSRSPSELERIVCSTDPVRPSTVVRLPAEPTDTNDRTPTTPAAISAARRASLDRLRKRLSGDLDTICLKALRKEPDRRYASAEQFLEDVRRHLSGQPVTARPDTTGYRLQKFFQRHRVGLLGTGAALVLMALLAGYYTVQLAAERDRARLEAEKATQVAEFLQDLFDAADPETSGGEEVTARTLLDAGAERAATDLADQPDVQEDLMNVIGHIYLRLGLFDEGQALFEQALAINRRLYGEEHPDVAENLFNLGVAAWRKAQYDTAERYHREALDMRRKLLGPDDPNVAAGLNDLGLIRYQKGDYEGARPLLEQAIDLNKQVYGEDHLEVATSLTNLALVLMEQGDYERALPLCREILAMDRRLLGDDHPYIAIDLNNLAIALEKTGGLEEAETLHRQSLALRRQLFGENHPDVGESMNNLGLTLHTQEQFEEAERLYLKALAIGRETLGDRHPRVALTLANLGILRADQDRFEEAEALLREALTIRRDQLGPEHPLVAENLHQLANVLRERGRLEEAEALLTESYTLTSATLGDTHAETRSVLESFVDLYDAWGRPADAARYRARLRP